MAGQPFKAVSCRLGSSMNVVHHFRGFRTPVFVLPDGWPEEEAPRRGGGRIVYDVIDGQRW